MRIILFFLLFTVTLTAQKTSKGIVTRVIDGDTYVVDVESYKGHEATLRIRITNADAPEIEFKPKRKPAQPYGHKAKERVAALIEGREVELLYWGKDRYKRVLAYVYIAGERLDDILIRGGMAWADRQYQKGKNQYKRGAALEAKAREQRIGLWNTDITPIRPSVYRKS